MSALEEKLTVENYVLKERIAQLERMLFSAKRERFVLETPSNQGTLFDLESVGAIEPEVVGKEVKLVKKKPKNRQGIKKNEFPKDLRRERTVIEPVELTEATADDFIKIGEDITELLAYTPSEIHVKQIVRPRYAQKEEKETEEKEEKSVIIQANIPPRLIPKGMVDESLLAQLIVEKILFHTPIHRFLRKLKQLGIVFLQENNLTNWFARTAESLLPLYYLLQKDILATGYIQADETRIQVLSKLKKNASHRGQMWVYFAPTIKATFFNYEPTRSTEAAEVILDGYQGIIQSDGYCVYQKIGEQQGVDIIHCMAHARRKFFDAKDNEPKLVNFILSKIQYLYKIEQQARDENLTHEQRYQLRQEKALPILKEIKAWLIEQSADVTILPKSKLKIALNYTLNLWKGLEAYAHDGKLEIDNNLVENTIRPVALGRKNYLFAGSHQAAQNLAIFYSIVGTCEKNNINVYEYLNWLLPKVATEKITPDAVNWLPHRVDPALLVK